MADKLYIYPTSTKYTIWIYHKKSTCSRIKGQPREVSKESVTFRSWERLCKKCGR